MSGALFRSEPLNLTLSAPAVLGVVRPFHVNRQSRYQSGQAHLLLTHMQSAFDFLHVRAVTKEDDHIAWSHPS